MPYRSKKQHRYFRWAESEGKLPEGTASRWAHETADMKALPDKKKVKEASYIPFSYGYGLLKLAFDLEELYNSGSNSFTRNLFGSPEQKAQWNELDTIKRKTPELWSEIVTVAKSMSPKTDPQEAYNTYQEFRPKLEQHAPSVNKELLRQINDPIKPYFGNAYDFTKAFVPGGTPPVVPPPAAVNNAGAGAQQQPTKLNKLNSGKTLSTSLGEGLNALGQTFSGGSDQLQSFFKSPSTHQWGKNMLGTLGAVGAGAWGLYNAFTNPQEKQPFQPSPTGLGQAQQPLRSVNQNIGRDIYGKKPTFSS
jgi:hypothetical protein